jgi:hypothetical protein
MIDRTESRLIEQERRNRLRHDSRKQSQPTAAKQRAVRRVSGA